MFHKRSARKPSDAFLLDFQRKFSGVATVPYTVGAGIVPKQLVRWDSDVGILPGLISNPTLLPSPRYSPQLNRPNCSCGRFNNHGQMCTALPDHPADASLSQTLSYNIDAEPLLLAPAYTLPHNLHGFQNAALQYQDHLSDFSNLPAQEPREISPPDSLIEQSSVLDEIPSAYDGQQPLRFQVTLHASTATYNPARQNPITYLNRRQGYKISITDTTPPVTLPHPVRYRTHFRMGFDNDSQRADPAAAWRLWRDNRGLKEASRSDGQLRAVEFVDVMSKVIRGRPTGSQVALENSSIDGFSIVWLADPQSGHAGCEGHILFNFLSTDFTLSKGVQGAPLRLYAKTELLLPDASPQPSLSTAEICYCRVKLFRDHGSERKIANDAVQLKRAINRVRQRLESLESGFAQGRLNTGKRKRGKPPAAARQQLQSFTTMIYDFSARDELQTVISDLEVVLSSSRPRSALSIRGDAQDDPGRFPIALSNPLQGSPASFDENLIKPRLVREITGSSASPASNYTQDHNHAAVCFYILRRIDGQVEEYYHALYLNERTLPDLLHHLSEKYQVAISSTRPAIRVNADGLRIVIDDDVVHEIPPGQDMIIEFSPDGDDPVGSSSRFRVTLFY